MGGGGYLEGFQLILGDVPLREFRPFESDSLSFPDDGPRVEGVLPLPGSMPLSVRQVSQERWYLEGLQPFPGDGISEGRLSYWGR